MKSLNSLVFLFSFIVVVLFISMVSADGSTNPQNPNLNNKRDNDTILLEEYFTDSLPGDWTQIKYDTLSRLWLYYNKVYYRIVIPNSDFRYAGADGWVYDFFNVGIFTRAVDISSSGLVLIDLDRNFVKGLGQDIAMIRVYSGGNDSINRADTLWLQAVSDPDEGVHSTFSIEPENYTDPSDIRIEFYLKGVLFSNSRFGIDNLIIKSVDFGFLEGYVYDSAQNPVANAEVGVSSINKKVFTNVNGYYNFGRIPVGNVVVYVKKTGINEISEQISVVTGQTIQHNFILYKPRYSVIPESFIDTLNPNEVLIDSLLMINTGMGDAIWNIEKSSQVLWLSEEKNEGVTPAGSQEYSVMNFNMNNQYAGTVLDVDLLYCIYPEVDTVTVPVTIYVEGTALGKVQNMFTLLVDTAFGIDKLTWDIQSYATLKYYIIERNNVIVDSITTTEFIDTLPYFGNFFYNVTPVYEEGCGARSYESWVTWGIPAFEFTPDTLEANVWINSLKVEPVSLWNSNYATEAYYEFEGFDMPGHTQDFVSMVAPYNGRLPYDIYKKSYVTLDATGYNSGDYSTVLTINTNQPDSINSHLLVAIMHVTIPGSFSGDVSDCDNGSPLNGVKIEAVNLQDSSEFVAWSDLSGYYHLLVDAGDYQLSFIKPGYDSVVVDSINAPAGITQVQQAQLCLTTNTAGWVNAKVNDADDSCCVSWNMPTGAYEIIYDDGIEEDFFLCVQDGDQVAVKFTPVNYPVTVTGGEVYVGKGTETQNKTGFFDREVIIALIDDNGESGMPGTILDTAKVRVTNFGWISFQSVFNVRIDSGDFYLSVIQLDDSVFSLPVAIDYSFSDSRSFYKSVDSGWELSNPQGMMIHATVKGPMQNLTRAFLNFKVARFNDFNPDAGETPEDGTGTILANNTSQLSLIDNNYGNLQMGWYAYGVKSVYETGTSQWKISNIVGHLMDIAVTVSVEQCDSLVPVGVYVTLTGKNYPWNIYVKQTDSNGMVYFDSIIKGTYNIKIYKPGYKPVIFNDILLMNDYSMSAILEENAYPARNLYVDSITSVATWDEPLVTALPLEGFEDTLFPPPGWQVFGEACDQWHRAGPDFQGGDWVVPPWDSYYALLNDDYMGSCSAASNDYLITPEVDLRDSENFNLYFDSFFDALYGGTATIEYSIDNGATWEILSEIIPSPEWKHDIVDLDYLSGEEGLGNVRLAFVYDDFGGLGTGWTGGWAVDNVEISSDPAPVKKYFVSLNGFPVAILPPDQQSYAFEDLEFGHYYTAAVRAGYSCGISEKIEYSWQSGYLYQPLNLYDEYMYNTNDVPLFWDIPDNPAELLSFNVYRNGEQIMNVPYNGDPGVTYWITDYDRYPGQYVYKITGVYDLTNFGYPDELGESGPSNNDTVNVVWGYKIPFEETWYAGNLDLNKWQTPLGKWTVDNQIGDNVPSVAFAGDTSLHDYSIPLISVPFHADSIIRDKIVYLDFDLKLDDDSATNTESLIVETVDKDSAMLITKVLNNGSFGFEAGRYHFNITKNAMSKVFWLKFTAKGQSSSIVHWYIDNIEIYTKCPEPENLRAEYYWDDNDNFGIEVCWQHPMMATSIKKWLHWDGENAQGAGFKSPENYTVAAYWPLNDLLDYEGAFLTRVSFYLLGTQSDMFDALYLKVWKGQSVDTLIFEKEMTEDMLHTGWNEYIFPQPIVVNKGDRLLIGYNIYGQVSGALPCGVDAGPGIRGRGDKVRVGNGPWQNVSQDPDYNFNWNIRALIEKPQERINSRYFNDYRLYRSETGEEGSYTKYATIPYDTSFVVCYNDTFPNTQPGNVYWYKVTASYSSETDTCESAFAKSVDNPDDDFVYVLVTDVDSKERNNNIVVFPNPAKDRITVSSDGDMSSITVYNYIGQIVYNKLLNGRNSVNLNTADYEAGVYVIRIETESVTTNKRVVITK